MQIINPLRNVIIIMFRRLAVCFVAVTLSLASDGAQNITLSSALLPEVGVRLSGNKPNSVNERIIAPAGDFNGDGIGDILLGDPIRPDSQGGAYIIFGKAGPWADIDLSAFTTSNSNGIRINGGGYITGIAISYAGDFNGDSYDDVLIGSWHDKAYVVFGSSNPGNLNLQELSTSNARGFVIAGARDLISGAGDFNGDGYDDIVVNYRQLKPGTANSYINSQHVLFGKAAGISNISLSGLAAADNVGFKFYGSNLDLSPVSVGDFDGDGFDDILICGRGTNVHLVYGKATGHVDIDISSPSSSFRFSTLMGPCGAGPDRHWSSSDINGDGFSDIAIPAYCEESSPDHKGAIGVVFGRSIPPSVLGSMPFPGSFAEGFVVYGLDSENIGDKVSEAGDVNGDGYDDILVPAPSATYNGIRKTGSTSGSYYVIYGKPANQTTNIRLGDAVMPGPVGFRIDGNNDASYRVAGSGVGDVNNDGFGDVVITEDVPNGTPSGSGVNYLVFGSASTSLVSDWAVY